MARGQILSVAALHDWEPTLFDDLQFPDVLDGDTLKNNIMIETEELEVLYPDPAVLKYAIGQWSARRIKTWNDMAAVLDVEDYNPFENVYRHEYRRTVQDRDLTYKTTGSSTLSVSAYNESTFQNREKNTPDLTNTDKGQIVNTDTFEVHGDSAISDTQDLIRKEMELRKLYDLYDQIIEEFKQRFCLLVY